MPLTELEQIAVDTGQEHATEILNFRDKAIQQRNSVLADRKDTFRLQAKSLNDQVLNENFEQSFVFDEVSSKGVLIAEGDSWFDYPFYDVLRFLEDDHGYDVESVAHKGDPVEAMAYSLGQLEELTRRIEKISRRGVAPKAILLSGGGNDVAGDQFGMLLNHARSGMPHLNEQIAKGVIEDRIRSSFITILSSVTDICRQRLGKPIPIIIHGYDYPVPDGRGFLGGFWGLPGPWLEPGFREKGYGDQDLKLRIAITQGLIARLNSMLQSVSLLDPFAAHVKYIDLRNSLSVELKDDEYKEWWGNELHPTEIGFKKISERFAAVLDSL